MEKSSVRTTPADVITKLTGASAAKRRRAVSYVLLKELFKPFGGLD